MPISTRSVPVFVREAVRKCESLAARVRLLRRLSNDLPVLPSGSASSCQVGDSPSSVMLNPTLRPGFVPGSFLVSVVYQVNDLAGCQ